MISYSCILLTIILIMNVGCQPFSQSTLGNVKRVDLIEDGGRLEDQEVLASIKAEQVGAPSLNKLRDLALRSFPSHDWNSYGPDSRYRTILISCERGKIELSSWHPIAEQSPNVVALSQGLLPLNGQSRDALLASDDQDYVSKREVFDELESMVIDLVKKHAKR